jgi:hypothetical protein
LNYILGKEFLRSVIQSDYPEASQQEVNEIRRKIEIVFLASINNILAFSDLKLVRISSDIFDMVHVEDVPQIIPDTKRITIGYVASLVENSRKDLIDGDFDSVITKSRTILEDVFTQILVDNGTEYKHNGDLNYYGNKVRETLGMKPESSWNPRVKELVSTMNKLVNVIAEMRNKDSDAHASRERVTVGRDEAELILNSAMTVGVYFLRVNDRKKTINE